METAKALNYKLIHLHLLRILYASKPISPKEIISIFAANYSSAYEASYTKEESITDAKIYAALKYMEKEGLIKRINPEARITRSNPPKYYTTSLGQSIIRQSFSLNVQSLLSIFVATFMKERQQKFIELGFRPKSIIGVIGIGVPLGHSIIGMLAEQAITNQENTSTNTIYFFDIAPHLQSLKIRPGELSITNNDILTDKTAFILHYRGSHFDSSGNFRLDIGSEQLDFIIAIALLGSFPEKHNVILQELYRTLKPNGIAILYELNMKDSFLTWLFQQFAAQESEILPGTFFSLLQSQITDSYPNIQVVKRTIRDVFGGKVEQEDFNEVQIFTAFKPV